MIALCISLLIALASTAFADPIVFVHGLGGQGPPADGSEGYVSHLQFNYSKLYKS